MNRNTSIRFTRLGIAILLLTGMLITLFLNVAPTHAQQTRFTVTPITGLVTTEAAGTATFTIVLNIAPTDDVSIALSSSDTTEGTVSPANLIFTVANWSTAQTVTVTGVEDLIDDGDVPYQIVSAPAVSTDLNFNGEDASDVSVTNIDNDTAGVIVSTISGPTSEGGTSATFTVVLTSQPTESVTIGLSGVDTTEGTLSTASLIFPPGSWNTAQTVTVTGVDDAVDDGDIIYTILTTATSVDAVYNNILVADVSVTNLDNDVAGFIVSPTSGLVTTEAGGSATFTIRLTSQPTASVTIGLSSSTINEGSVSPASLTFTTVNWSTPQTVTVTGVNDFVIDGNIPYTIVTAQPTGSDALYNSINPADVSVINNDNDVAGFTVSTISGPTSEVGTTATFTVVLTSQPTASVTIGLSSSNINEGTVLPISLVFTTGNWNVPQTVTVTGVNDFVIDGNTPYTIVTAPAVSADGNYTGKDAADVAVTNNDNDIAGITVAPLSGLTTTEASGTATFTVVLNTQPAASVTINLSSSDTTEGTVAPASLTFTTANWAGPQTVIVTGVDDLNADGNIAYTINTAAATSTDGNYNGLDAANVAVTNTDNDVAAINVSNISGQTTEAGGTATFTVVLGSQPTANVTIGLSSSNTNEGTVSPASLVFTNANWNTAQTVTVTGANDFVVDGSVVYTIITAPATSTDGSYSGRDAADVAVTNTDNDAAGIAVSTISGPTTEAGGTATFTVVLGSQPTATVTIGMSSNDLTEGTVSTASLVFTAANWNAAQTVTVTGVPDSVVDGNIGYTIVTAQAVSTDALYAAINPADVAVTNNDDDAAGFTVTPLTGLVTSEAGATATFTIRLTSEPTADVAIAMSSSDTGEGNVSPVSVTFTSVNWSAPQTVTVTGANDSIVDGTIAYTIITAPANTTDSVYNGLNPADVAVTNTDNDVAEFTVTPTAGLTTTELGGTATFTVVLTSQPSADVTISLSSSDTTEGMVAPASLTFTAANWNVAQTVTITGVDDLVDDGNIAYTIATALAVSADINYSGKDPANVSVTNTDNDTAGITVTPVSGLNTSEAGGTATFTVVLTSEPTANVTIGLSSLDTTEGTVSSASVIFTTTNWNAAQTVTVTGVNDFIVDGPIAYTIDTAAATSTDPVYSGMNPANVSLTNTDNDIAGNTVNRTSGLVTTEAGVTDTFTVVLNTQPLNSVTIGLSSSNTIEVTVSPPSLTFTTTNWNAAQTVTVTGVRDDKDDGDQPFNIVTANTTSLDPLYNDKVVQDVTGTNQNIDFRPVAVNDFYQTNAKPDQPFNKTAPGVLSNDTDANNDALTAILVDPPTKGTLTLFANGSFVYTPNAIYTTIETDSFTYRANDGKDFSSLAPDPPARVDIVIDTVVPEVTWSGPVKNGNIYEIRDNEQFLLLKVDPVEYSISQVRFFRWDWDKKIYVDIGVVNNQPYEWNLDTSTLNYLWNQVFVSVRDGAGNTSSYPSIWLYRDLPLKLFMPRIAR